MFHPALNEIFGVEGITVNLERAPPVHIMNRFFERRDY